MLELLSVADVASEFWALVLGMSLQLSKSLPNDLRSSRLGPASVRELAKVNAVPQHLVDLLHEVSSGLAVGAADLEFWSHEFSLWLAS